MLVLLQFNSVICTECFSFIYWVISIQYVAKLNCYGTSSYANLTISEDVRKLASKYYDRVIVRRVFEVD